MKHTQISATENSPEVDFDYASNVFGLRGMSYMEDANSFYDSLQQELKAHLNSLKSANILFEFALEYFNSSSARIVFHLLQLLDEAAGTGNQVQIKWLAGDDEDIAEEGEDLAEDLEHASFEVVLDN